VSALLLTAIGGTLLFILNAGSLGAAEEALVSGGESPNKQFRVVLIDSAQDDDQPSAYFRFVPSGKIIGEWFVGSWANYRGAVNPINTEVIWTPDSRYAAIKSRGTKRSTEVDIFRVSAKGISQIKIEDYVPAILKGLGNAAINRYILERPIRWDSPTELVIDVTGDCVIGPRNETGIWRSFHYEVCVTVPSGKAKWIKQLELKDETG
jgi:hypothetical protein